MCSHDVVGAFFIAKTNKIWWGVIFPLSETPIEHFKIEMLYCLPLFFDPQTKFLEKVHQRICLLTLIGLTLH